MKTCRKGLHQYEGGRCPECKKAYSAAWDRAHNENRRARGKKWKKAHRDYVKEYAAKWDRDHRELVKERNAARDPERQRAYTAAWRKANPEANRELWRRRRALKRGVGYEPVTAAHLKLLFEAQDGRCRYCPTLLGEDKHLDHRIPLARGGPHSPSNVCWSCPSCNLKKSTKTEQEFLNG